MGNRFHVYATNDVTSVLIVRKFTLAGALSSAADLMEDWTDIHIREYPENYEDLAPDSLTFKVVAKLSDKGLMF